jgi:hypothetical protein
MASQYAFVDATRQRSQQFVTQAFAANGRFSFELPRVGFISGIHLCLKGTLTRSAGDTGAFSPRMSNILQRVSFSLNLGASSVIDISGFGLYFQNQTMYPRFGMDLGGSIASVATGTANGANNQAPSVFRADATVPGAPPPVATPFVFSWWVPVAVNDGLNFNIGVYNLQAQEIRASLDVLFGSVADLFPAGSVVTGTSLAATLQASYWYFEVPNPRTVVWPPLLAHRLLEEKMPFSNTGDVTYTFPPMGTLTRWGSTTIINGLLAQSGSAAGGDIVGKIVRANKSDDFYRFTPENMAMRAAQRYGHALPEGCTVVDLLAASSVVDGGIYRDTINTEDIATLEDIEQINNASVLGPGNNFREIWREIIQPLAF